MDVRKGHKGETRHFARSVWQIDFAEGRAEAPPLPDGALDIVLSSTVFEEGSTSMN